MADPQDIKPVPDPTALTTTQLHDVVGSAEKTINTRIDGVEKLFEAELRTMEVRFMARYMFFWAAVLGVIAMVAIGIAITLVVLRE